MSTNPLNPESRADEIIAHTLAEAALMRVTAEIGDPAQYVIDGHKPRAESDYFPCAFCDANFAEPGERGTHEETCSKADLLPNANTEPRELPTPFTVEIDPLLSQGMVYTMLRRAGLKLVDRGENRPYLLTFESDSLLTRIERTEIATQLINAEAERIKRARDRW